MPLYEYKCRKCARSTEKIESVSGPHLRKCPHCGGRVESVISAPAIQFKGSGWYVTDYAGKSADSVGAEAKGGSDGKEASGAGASAKDSSGKEAASKDSGEKSAASKDTSAKDKTPAKKK